MSTAAEVKADTKDVVKVTEPNKYNVIFENDNVTPMDFVVALLQNLFNYSHEKAYEIMLLIHQEGQAVVATYHFEIAEQKALECTFSARQNGYPLEVKVKPAWPFYMIYLEYTFDITGTTITLDNELDLSNIDWEDGDLFRLEIRPNGAARFIKVSKLEQFVLDEELNKKD